MLHIRPGSEPAGQGQPDMEWAQAAGADQMERPGFFGGMDNMILDELNKASKRWMVNDDGTLTPENKPSTGSLDTIVTQDQENVKSIFDLVREAAHGKAGQIHKR